MLCALFVVDDANVLAVAYRASTRGEINAGSTRQRERTLYPYLAGDEQRITPPAGGHHANAGASTCVAWRNAGMNVAEQNDIAWRRVTLGLALPADSGAVARTS